MFWSKTFIPTLKETPESAESVSHKLMLRAGLVHMLISGVYSYLPLGLRVLKKICDIIRQELDSVGCQELLLPCIQPLELWVKTKRDIQLGETLIKFKDRRRNLCLGPTHEEVITDLVKDYLFSYKQLPLILYQIQTKFRDELRPRFGLVRSCEFIMKDAYSFDSNEEGLDKNYHLMYGCYCKIFKRMDLNFKVMRADPGVMGGSLSEEFMVPSESGEDKLEDGSSAIEIGHIFKLGTKYSQILGVNFLDRDSKQKLVTMGCYGIGVSRLISAIIEQNSDSDGIIWPKQIAPYQVVVTPVDFNDRRIRDEAINLYEELIKNSIEVLLDDRTESAGVKFKDADLIGVPLRLVVGRETPEGKVELKTRKDKRISIIDKKDILNKIKTLLKRE